MLKPLSEKDIGKLLAHYKGASLSDTDRDALKVRILSMVGKEHRRAATGERAYVPFSFRRIAFPVTVIFAVFLIASGTVVAADQAKPGDFLFPIDKGIENVRFKLTRSPARRAELKLEVAKERAEELGELSKNVVHAQPAHSQTEAFSLAVEEAERAFKDASSAIEAAAQAQPAAPESFPVQKLKEEFADQAVMHAEKLRTIEKSVPAGELKMKLGESVKYSEAVAESVRKVPPREYTPPAPPKEDESDPLQDNAMQEFEPGSKAEVPEVQLFEE